MSAESEANVGNRFLADGVDDAASASRGAGTSKAGRIGRDGTDETYIGGVEPDLPGGRAQGKKVLTGVAVEVREPKGMGRCRMAPLADVSAASLDQFVTDHVEPGATVVADGWRGYRGLDKLGYSTSGTVSEPPDSVARIRQATSHRTPSP